MSWRLLGLVVYLGTPMTQGAPIRAPMQLRQGARSGDQGNVGRWPNLILPQTNFYALPSSIHGLRWLLQKKWMQKLFSSLRYSPKMETLELKTASPYVRCKTWCFPKWDAIQTVPFRSQVVHDALKLCSMNTALPEWIFRVQKNKKYCMSF